MLNARGFRGAPHTLVVNNAIKDTRPVTRSLASATPLGQIYGRSFPRDSYVIRPRDTGGGEQSLGSGMNENIVLTPSRWRDF